MFLCYQVFELQWLAHFEEPDVYDPRSVWIMNVLCFYQAILPILLFLFNRANLDQLDYQGKQ